MTARGDSVQVETETDWIDLPKPIARAISDDLGRAHDAFDRAYHRAATVAELRSAIQATRARLADALTHLPPTNSTTTERSPS